MSSEFLGLHIIKTPDGSIRYYLQGIKPDGTRELKTITIHEYFRTLNRTLDYLSEKERTREYFKKVVGK
jgi:hypothetical protein